MSRPPGGTASEAARGAGSAVAKGALLIGLAVVIGVILLNQVDNGPSKSAASTPVTTKPKTTTTTVHKTKSSTTTAPLAPAKSPAEVSLIVLNGGAPTGSASKMSSQLKQQHYTNQPNDANNWSGHSQQGNSVLCKSGLDREAVALSVAVGSGTQVQPFPTPPPPYSDNVMCVVVVGATGSGSTSTGGGATTTTQAG